MKMLDMLNPMIEYYYERLREIGDKDAELLENMNIETIGIEWLRALTAKPSRNATQHERDIYRYACGLMVALEGGVEV